MKAVSCFVLVSCLCISANVAFAFPFQQHKEAEQAATPVSAVGNDAPNIPSLNEFGNDNIFSIGTEFMKKAQQRIAQLEQSVINKIKHHTGHFEPKVYEMQNKTSKEIKIQGDRIVETEEKIVSIGDQNNGTIAIYKLIKFRPIANAQSVTSPPHAVEGQQIAEKTQPTPDKTQPLDDNVQSPVTKIEPVQSAQPDEKSASADPGQTIEKSQTGEQVTPEKKQVNVSPGMKVPEEVAKKLDTVESKDVSSQFFK